MVLAVTTLLFAVPVHAAGTIDGRVLGAGAPIAKSTVTLWAASAGAPQQLGQAQTGDDGRFTLSVENPSSPEETLYIVARGGEPAAQKGRGGNPAVALLSVIGSRPPAHVTINELTTVASVWTHNQFIDGITIKGKALGLRIAAGNVPNFVDLATGGYGGAIQDPLNGPQTPTLANFATLADLLAGCIAQVQSDACSTLFAAAVGPAGSAPADTLGVAESVARYNWYKPARLFALLNKFYPLPQGKNLRVTPFVPYLNFAPSAWVLPLKFDGGGIRAAGKMGVDADGNIWAGDNFTVGAQAQDVLWQGNLSEFAPNGRPLSPPTTGFTGGGVEGVGFGLAIDSHDNVWVSTYGGQSIAVFDKHGKPLTPPDGITFGHRLGLMQGVLVAPNGDVWVVGVSKNQLVYFPKGDWHNGRLVCEGFKVPPCSAMAGPFHLVIDAQDRIWVSNGAGTWVTRFRASDPSKPEKFHTSGFSLSGMNVDSRGNVWVTNRFGRSPAGIAAFLAIVLTAKTGGNPDRLLTQTLAAQSFGGLGTGGGSVAMLKPDGTPAPGSPFSGPSLPGPWAIAVDGDDQIWVSNFARSTGGPIAHLCGVRTETCPPGMKTGDPISPPRGYVGGGMQQLIDIDIDPAGDLWVSNNWQDIQQCFGTPLEELSTRCGGQGVTVFYGMAKPIRTPQIGLPQSP